MTAPATRWGHWLRLVRPPNLPTVPGDPLAGFVMASGVGATPNPALPWVMLSTTALYAAGLVLNDVADYRLDCRDRPDRPLPCGTVPRNAALVAGLLLGAAGIAAAGLANGISLLIAVGLFGLILVYDSLMPRGSLGGVLVMGLCRCGSVAMGIAASGKASTSGATPWLAAAGTGLYIVAVSWIATGETEAQRVTMRRWLPAALLVVTFGSLATVMTSVPWEGAVLAGITLAVAWNLGWRLGPEPKPASVPGIIGGFIRALIPLQASYCALAGGWGTGAALMILCLWPLSAVLAKRYYAS